jgi:hypothetical protein
MKRVAIWNGVFAASNGSLGVFNYVNGRYFLSNINWFMAGVGVAAVTFCLMIGDKK